MQKQDFHEVPFSNGLYEEEFDEDMDFSSEDDTQLETPTKSKRLHARRSVDEYLEHKRLRQRYKDLFDEYFGEEK